MRLLQPLLMAPGPFYFYPWKPVVNAVAGDDYMTGYKHFASGHSHFVNLALHCVCLFIQVFGNFGLLNVIDGRINQPVQGVRILSALSAISWSAYLLVAAKGAPLVARLGSAAVLALGYQLAPQITREHLDLGAPLAMIIALLVSNYGLTRARLQLPAKPVAKLVAIMGAWAYAWPYLEGAYVNAIGGAVPQHTNNITALALLYTLGVTQVQNPLSFLVLTAVPLLRLASAAAGGDPLLFFWSYGFAGSLFQGLTHRTVAEEATLLALERETEQRKLKFEWSHVTFFPVLLLHRVMQRVKQG